MGVIEELRAEIVELREEVTALRERREERLLDLKGVADLLSVSEAAAGHLSRSRKIPRVTLPGTRSVRFDRDAVLAHVRQGSEEARS